MHERALLAGGKLVVGSRFARAFVTVYAVLLHMFVVLLLYYALHPVTRVELVNADALSQQGAAAATAAVAGAGRAAAAGVAGLR